MNPSRESTRPKIVSLVTWEPREDRVLLPDDSHAKHGLMEANWDSGHFRLASAGLLHFSQETAALIRQGLER